MNNLKNMRTYLAGAMDRVPDGGIGWRNAITPMLQELSVSVINPCDKPIESAKEGPTTRQILIITNKLDSLIKLEKNMVILEMLI